MCLITNKVHGWRQIKMFAIFGASSELFIVNIKYEKPQTANLAKWGGWRRAFGFTIKSILYRVDWGACFIIVSGDFVLLLLVVSGIAKSVFYIYAPPAHTTRALVQAANRTNKLFVWNVARIYKSRREHANRVGAASFILFPSHHFEVSRSATKEGNVAGKYIVVL